MMMNNPEFKENVRKVLQEAEKLYCYHPLNVCYLSRSYRLIPKE